MSGNKNSGNKSINEKISQGMIRSIVNSEMLNLLEDMKENPASYPLEIKLKILLPLAMKFIPEKIELGIEHTMSAEQLLQIESRLLEFVNARRIA